MTLLAQAADLRQHRAGESVLHGQQAGRHRARQRRDGEGADEARTALHGRDVAVDDLLEATTAGVDDDRHAVSLLRASSR